MLTLKEILKSDPNSIPIEEYDRIFKFMTMSNVPEEEIERKQAYLQSYRCRKFLLYSGNPLVGSVAIYLFALLIGKYPYVSLYTDRIFYFFWHWGPPAEGRLFYFRVCGSVSLSWMAWLFWRIYADINDKGVFIREDVDGAFANISNLGLIILIAPVFLFLFATIGPVSFNSLTIPSIHDGIHIYTFKKVAMISCAYWTVGFSFLLISTCIRWVYRRK